MEDEQIVTKLLNEMADSLEPLAITVNQNTFSSLLQKAKMPVVIDFWADWCMPCRMMSPVMDELAKAYQGKVLFGKVNVDENPQIAGTYGIMSIPHFLIFRNGTVVEKIVGAVGRGPLENAIKKHM